MTAPVRRPSVPSAVGENRDRIRTLEAVRPWGPMVQVSTIISQTIPSSATIVGGTSTLIEFETVGYQSPDAVGMVDLAGHPTRILIVRPGVYLLGGNVGWEPSLATDARSAAPITNPVSIGAGVSNFQLNLGDNVNPFRQGGMFFAALDSGYQVNLEAVQTSGSPTDITQGSLGVQWVAPFGGY